MVSQYTMNYPSPRGIHVPEAYTNSGDGDPYRRDSVHSPHRNRYSRSLHRSPRVRDVTWIASPDPTPQSLHAPSTPWSHPPQVPSSPTDRPPSAVPPSPAPTVGEHMNVDDAVFVHDGTMDPYTYQPQRQGDRVGLVKSFWNGLKKLSGFWSSPYGSRTMEMPVPRPLAPSETSQYVNPTPPEMEEQHVVTPYASPYVRPTNTNLVTTPVAMPTPLRASPAPISPVVTPPPITVISPSIESSSLSSSGRSVRMPLPATGTPKNLSARRLEPVVPSIEDGSHTLHEPVPDRVFPLPAPTADGPIFPGSEALALDSASPSKGSLSTMAHLRRFVTEWKHLPWVSETHIVDEYVPERNPRSQMRKRVRQGAEPSWYNSRPEILERPEYWSEWDLWAKQSTAALGYGLNGEGAWGGVGGTGRVMYPHGYVPAQPGFVYPSGYPPPGVVNNQAYAPVLP